MDGITCFLTRKLKRVVNEHKSRVAKTNDCTFLGFTFRGMKLRWSTQAYRDFKHNVRRLTGRSWGISMAYRLFRLAPYVRGWMGYWKKWCKPRTKVRHLLALGTGKRQGDPHRAQLQELLASVEDTGHADRDDQ